MYLDWVTKRTVMVRVLAEVVVYFPDWLVGGLRRACVLVSSSPVCVCVFFFSDFFAAATT